LQSTPTSKSELVKQLHHAPTFSWPKLYLDDWTPNWASYFQKASGATMPLLPQELLIPAIEMVCYFFTAIGVALTFFVARHA
jgi:hypothetical protein